MTIFSKKPRSACRAASRSLSHSSAAASCSVCPLHSLLRVACEFARQRERAFVRDVQTPAREGRRNGQAHRVAVERSRFGQPVDVEEVLHPAVRQSESHHRLGLLRNGGLWPISAAPRAWEVEETRIIQDFRWRHDGVSGADVDLKRDSDVSEHGHQLDAHATVLLVLADRLDVNAVRQKRQAVIW